MCHIPSEGYLQSFSRVQKCTRPSRFTLSPSEIAAPRGIYKEEICARMQECEYIDLIMQISATYIELTSTSRNATVLINFPRRSRATKLMPLPREGESV